MIQNFKRTRFAPSPTGYLHLGHVLSAIYVWTIAEKTGASVLLRIEDHDRGRYRKEYEDAILADLKWLGFLNKVESIQNQRDRADRYTVALERLKPQVYACRCTRKEIKERVPNQNSDELKYDQFCRFRNIPWNGDCSLRFHVSDEKIKFRDLILGDQSQTPLNQCGDFILKDKDGFWSYQYCVVVDDMEQEIDLVVRGVDILESTGRQLMLRKELGGNSQMTFAHHPLLIDDEGKKLSKRFLSSSIAQMRTDGKTPEDILGEAAYLAGLIPSFHPIEQSDFSHLNFLPNAVQK